MENKTLIYIGIGFMALLLIGSILATAGVFSKKQTGATSGGNLDTTGWTENEIMNYEMHGTVPARVSGSGSASSSGGMVGGC